MVAVLGLSKPVVSVAVMAHPKRKRWVPDLAAALGGDVEVVWDRRNDRWDTGRRSLLARDPSASHHLVVQDDAIVCGDLMKGLTVAAEFSGDRPVSLYMGRIKRGSKVEAAHRRAVHRQWSWVEAEGPLWGVGILLPVEHVRPVVEFGDSLNIPNYDLRIAAWYASIGMRCWYTRPSLVEHRHGGTNPSLVANRTGTNRYAHRFLGGQRSALEVDWSAVPT